MTSSIEQKVLDILEGHDEPLTAAFISFSLSDCPFDEIEEALDDLWKAGTITLDSYGYSLCKQTEPEVQSPQELVQDNPTEGTPLPEVLGEQGLPSSMGFSSQIQDEYRALLDLIAAGSVEPDDNAEPDEFALLATLDIDDPEPDDTDVDLPEDSSITCWTSISSLELPTRARNYLPSKGITTVRELVRHLESLGEAHGLGVASLDKIEQELVRRSAPLPSTIDDQLLPSLCDISGSQQFVFDSLGILRQIPKPAYMHRAPTDPLSQKALFNSTLPITSLMLSNRLLHVLKNAGYTTVGEVARLSKDTLQAMRGLGAGSLFELEDTLRQLADGTFATHSPRPLGQDEPYPYSLLIGDQTPLAQLGLPNRLSKALAREGFTTVGDLSSLSDEKILSFRGIGVLAVEQLHGALDGFLQNAEMREAANHSDEAGEPLLDQPSSAETSTAETEESVFLNVSQNARKGAELALESCKELEYPVFEDSFLVIMPQSAVEMIGDGLEAEDYRDIIIDTIEGSEDLLSSCTTTLLKWVRQAQESCSPSAVEELEILDSFTWNEAARRVAASTAWCSFDANRRMLLVNHPHLMDWIEQPTFDENTRLVLRMFLSGQTLEACGQRVGLTKERVRQIVLKKLGEMPFVSENRYRHFFETYEPSKEVFLSVTGEPVAAYLYLRATRNHVAKDTHPTISSALNDEQVPQHVRDGIRRLLDKDYVYEDGYRIHIDRVSIINYIAMRHASARLIKIKRFYDLYNGFLADHNLTRIKSLPFNTAHNFEAYLDRCEMILRLPHAAEGRYGGSIRYYDPSAMDFEPLVSLIRSGVLGDVECSAAMLLDYDGFPKILEDLDIHNEYELHYVLSRYCTGLGDVSFGRSPIITFGAGNRNEQILDLIKELSPVTAGDLASEYSKRYGVDNLTFVGSYLNDFKIYLRNGKYVYNTQGFNDEQAAFIKGQLESSPRDYLSISLLKARFKDRFPDASSSLINGESVAPFGFHPSAGLLIRNGIDERSMFAQLLDSVKRFSINDDGFGKAVFDNPLFTAELAIRVRAFKLVEFEKDGYLASSILSELGSPFNESDLRDYLESAMAFMAPNRPYTVKSLGRSGFSHRIDELRDEAGLDDFFFASLLRNGTVGGRLKVTSIGNTPVFCKTFYSYSSPIMLEQIIDEDGALEIDELADLLEDEYGIHENTSNLRSIAKRSDLYFNEILDMVFGSEETYRRKAQEWIS